jgi:hypothetical protein
MIAKRSKNVQHESKKCGLKNGVFTESSMISKGGKFCLLFAHAEAPDVEWLMFARRSLAYKKLRAQTTAIPIPIKEKRRPCEGGVGMTA